MFLRSIVPGEILTKDRIAASPVLELQSRSGYEIRKIQMFCARHGTTVLNG